MRKPGSMVVDYKQNSVWPCNGILYLKVWKLRLLKIWQKG